MDEIRQVERKVMDREKEISRKGKRISMIEMSKEELQDKLNEQKLSERINLSMSMVDLNSSFSPVGYNIFLSYLRSINTYKSGAKLLQCVRLYCGE